MTKLTNSDPALTKLRKFLGVGSKPTEAKESSLVQKPQEQKQAKSSNKSLENTLPSWEDSVDYKKLEGTAIQL